ncbi:MAG TPA: response regulator transcription factor [Kofleriaceae bacterium]
MVTHEIAPDHAVDVQPQVAVVAALVSPLAQTLSDAMTREALHVEVTTADVLRDPPRSIVYLFLLDASLAIAFADPIVKWAVAGPQTPGLIGVVEDGGGHEREALLAAGFDDAISGRPSPRELVARVRAVQRRLRTPAPTDRLRYGAFTLDLREHVLWMDAVAITLTSIELSVMRELMKARGRPLSRVELLDVAWGGGDLETTERAVDNVILRLRRKLPRPDALETVRGVGFRLANE